MQSVLCLEVIVVDFQVLKSATFCVWEQAFSQLDRAFPTDAVLVDLESFKPVIASEVLGKCLCAVSLDTASRDAKLSQVDAFVGD